MNRMLSREYFQTEGSVWARMLGGYVPNTGWRRNPNCGVIRILDIGCGFPVEAHTFVNLFGRNISPDQYEGVHFTGLDDNSEIIRGLAEPFFNSIPSITFKVGDARRVASLVEGPFCIVVYSNLQVKHPLGGWDETWEEVIPEAASIHHGDGLLIATFYGREELRRARDTLFQLHYEIKISGDNEYRLREYGGHLNRHRYVLFGIRR